MTTGSALGRAAAVLAVGSAGVHLLLAGTGELSALAMAVMALACLPCAWHLWRAPSGHVWALTALVDAGMLAVHAPMVVGGGHAGMAHGPSAPAVAGLALVTGQLVVAGVALLRRPASVPGRPAVGAALAVGLVGGRAVGAGPGAAFESAHGVPQRVVEM